MSAKINQWIDAIINEDGDKLSNGSLRTLQMIKKELFQIQYTPICPRGEICQGGLATVSCPDFDVVCVIKR